MPVIFNENVLYNKNCLKKPFKLNKREKVNLNVTFQNCGHLDRKKEKTLYMYICTKEAKNYSNLMMLI